jgi:formate hydrogenlyase transcriptional activator
VFPIQVPALRERADDIPGLVWHFVEQCSAGLGKRIETIADTNMRQLQQYGWPGNIRELRNVVERAMILATGPRLSLPVPRATVSSTIASTKIDDVQRNHIRSVLERVRWRIRGTGGAAEQLGLRPTTLETRMSKLGLIRPRIA